MDFVNVFKLITLFVILIAIVFAKKSFDKKSDVGNWLGTVFIMIVIVCASYICSISYSNYFWSSLFSSVYFVGNDLLLVSLVHFVYAFTRMPKEQSPRIQMQGIYLLMAFDIISLMINPFWEIAVHYEWIQTEFLSKYNYVMKPLFVFHLTFTYMLVIFVMYRLIRKAITAPAGYRRQYCLSVGGIVVIVAVNAVFLYFPKNEMISLLDFSILGYSMAGFFLYWMCFEYSSHGLLNMCRDWILQAVDQGIVLFDYKDQLILYNDVAKELLPETAIRPNRSFRSFMNECKLSYDSDHMDAEIAYQFYLTNKGNETPVRFDYRLMKNSKNEVIGKLLIFTNIVKESDLLTGFMNWNSFARTAEIVSDQYVQHRSVAVCDINNLSEINDLYGRNVGDRAVAGLARLMRTYFPGNTLFVRGKDASLIALCTSSDESTVRGYLEKALAGFHIRDYTDETVQVHSNAQGAVYVLPEAECSLVAGVNEAFRGMRARKLMDDQSHHSALMTSLMRALEECDPDTSDHVRRTQELGAKLGRRIELKDVELSSLSLLCMLHDIGKIGVPLDILNKPGKLNESEWEHVRSHVEKGYQIANSSNELKGIANMILHHHERWDGNGYPDGLSKESIPLLSRVIAVVDAYDAMIHDRSYRKAIPVEDALAEISKHAGTQFDPRIAASLIDLINEEQIISGEGEYKAKLVREDNDKENGFDREEEMMRLSSRQVHDIVFSRYVLDEENYIVDADSNFEKLTGYSREDWECQKMNQMDLIFPEDKEVYQKMLRAQLDKNNVAYIEHRIRRKNKSTIYVYCYGRPGISFQNQENRTEILITDVTRTYAVQTMINNEQKKAKERLKHWEEKYRCDSLTGLLTHEAFRNDIEVQLLEKTSKILYLIMDVDYFKQYNDTNGHHKGDEFLINVGQMMMSQIRAEDLACRIGGDEFAAALFFSPRTSDESMLERAQKIYSKINMTLTQSEGNVSLSMGVVSSSQIEKCTYSAMYEAADQALYESKKRGRARMTIYESKKHIL